jgi:ABC-type protease/lipase transport system fused ATPase/permease subunit
MLNFATNEIVASLRVPRHLSWLRSALLNLLSLVPMLYMLHLRPGIHPRRTDAVFPYAGFVVRLVFRCSIRAFALLVRASIRLDRLPRWRSPDTSLARRDKTTRWPAKLRGIRYASPGYWTAIIALCDAPGHRSHPRCLLIHPFIGLLVLVGAVLLAIVAMRNQRKPVSR